MLMHKMLNLLPSCTYISETIMDRKVKTVKHTYFKYCRIFLKMNISE